MQYHISTFAKMFEPVAIKMGNARDKVQLQTSISLFGVNSRRFSIHIRAEWSEIQQTENVRKRQRTKGKLLCNNAMQCDAIAISISIAHSCRDE